MSVHTCPRCELRFEFDSELRAHLVADHGLDADAVRPHLVPRPRDESARHRVVVVGNHTLLSDNLRTRLVALVGTRPSRVDVVVPVSSDNEIGIAEWRAQALADRMQDSATDVEVNTIVKVGDPVDVVERALAGTHVDEIVVSHLPAGISAWLHADVVGRLQHVFGVPVEPVAAEGG
ncbi:MAG: hypothetical protein ACRD0G_02395 [Acidimicrobiales bacterium]